MIPYSQTYPLQQPPTDKQKDKVRHREAVENSYENWVEPLQKISHPIQTQLSICPNPPQPKLDTLLLLVLLLWFFILWIHIRYLLNR